MKRATDRANGYIYGSVISIHALVKRATSDKGINEAIWQISIHALVKRATEDVKDCSYRVKISIHALVKRATTLRFTMAQSL